MPEKSRQHFIPRGYLQSWADPKKEKWENDFIWLIPKEGGEPKRKSPGNCLFERDMYTIPETDGSRNLQLEDMLGTLESSFYPVRQKIARHEVLSEDEWHILATFMAAMASRTPSQREHHRAQWSSALEIMDETQARIDKMSTEEKKKFARRQPLSSGTGASMTHTEVRQLVELPMQSLLGPMTREQARIFISMTPTVLYTTDPQGFITSDNPVTVFDPLIHTYPPILRGSPALGSPSIEVTFPLDPNHLLILGWNKGAGILDATGNGHSVAEANRRTAAYANKLIVNNTRNQDSRWFSDRPIPPYSK